MKTISKPKRLLSLLLAAFVALPAFGLNSVQAADPVTLSATSPASHYDNYFQDVYPSLNDVNSHVFKTVTYEDLVTLLGSKGTFAILIGGSWSDETNADIRYINEVAKANNVQTIYNFDTRLDGVNPGLDLAVTHPPFTATAVSGSNATTNYFDYTEYYVELVNKYLTNLTTLSSVPASYQNKSKKVVNTSTGTETTASTLVASGSAKAVQSPYLLIYNKDNVVNGVSAPVVSYLEKHGSGNATEYTWDSYFKNNPTNVTNYKAQVQEVFNQAAAAGYAPSSFNTLTSWDFIGPQFNSHRASGTIEIFPSKTENGKVVPDLGANNVNELDSTLVFEHVTYHQLTKLLNTSGNYAILFGGSWCPNTQAEIRWINRYAKAHNIDKIYFFDTRLDAGVGVTIRNPLASTHDDGTTLQTRDNETANPLAYLYGDLVAKNLKNIQTTYLITGSSSQTVTYTDPTTSLSKKVNKLQVPYLFTFNKDNKDTSNSDPATNAAPILGHVEIMNGWGSTYTGTGAINSQYAKYEAAVNSLFSRLEGASPSGLTVVGASALAANDGQIKDISGGGILEYRLKPADNQVTSFTNVAGTAITGLPVGTYQVRYASKGFNTGYNQSTGAGTVTYAAANSNYKEITIKVFQAAPTGLAGVGTSSWDLNDGKITGTVAGLEYKLLTADSYSDASLSEITGLAPGKYQVRFKAKDDYDASLPTEVVVTGKRPAPSLTVVAPTSSDNADGKITGIVAGLEYKLSSASSYADAPVPAITGLASGTYQVRYKATDVYSVGPDADFVVLKFQEAPIGLHGVKPTSAANNNGQITIDQQTSIEGLTFNSSKDADPIAVTDRTITTLQPGTYYFWYAAQNGFAASAQTEVIVPSYEELAPPSGLSAVGTTNLVNNDGQITGVASSEYTLEIKKQSDSDYANANIVDGAIKNLTPGVYLVRFGAYNGLLASQPIALTVQGHQAAPSGLSGVAPTAALNDGEITGASSALEYRVKDTGNYQDSPGSTITGLTAGNYEVRVKRSDLYLASEPTIINVPAYVAPDTGGGNTGGGNTGGGNTGGGNTGGGGTTTPTTPTDNGGIVTTPGTVAVTAPSKTDATTGDTLATLSKETVSSLVSNVKKTETAGKSSVVEVKVETTEQTKSAQLSLPKSAFNDIATGTNADVKVNYGNIGTISFDSKAIKTINSSAATEDVSIIITKSELTPEGKEVLGDRPVYDFSVFVGNEKVSSFGGGKASISIPYALKAGESPESVIIYYVTDEGELQTVRGHYNARTGTVDFTTTHFSQYIVGYNAIPFADVSGSSWYGKAVNYLAARDITGGTDSSHFSPDAALTRGQFIVLLLKAYGIQAADGGADNFADSGSNKYYTNYLAAAKKLGIATGVGDNRFAPDKAITRQELFTLLYRSLGLLGELPTEKTGATVGAYGDAGQIAGYAQSAVQALVESGVITGSNAKLNPKGVTTRAQAAQVLYNLLSK
ncbi:S-layer homology domain-containing protein [Cohnella endophytica]|uniref:S-layer homology domain-containing protein n=1 Tax=Cohnella endophytica TaxID=2419778 RepID=A0A494XPL3_9BACL|nr:S-layer homology domain-containing protein [Cohnella endophytica]RKP50004.1 S-layer homology domain-containing protein [Cohnella endophytica]